MAQVHPNITPDLQTFISKQHLFFVATAPLSQSGHVNLSPKGTDCFRILSENRVAYLDLIGSGTETSAHLLENGRITFMFCSFDGAPNILRLYGRGYSVLPGTAEWEELIPSFEIPSSVRQILVADIERVQTSCGFVIPLYDYAGERDIHQKWSEEVGPAGLEAYKQEHSLISIDGLPTAISKSQ